MSVRGVAAAAAAAPSALEAGLLANVVELPERKRNNKRKFIKHRGQKRRKQFDMRAKLAQGLLLVATKGFTGKTIRDSTLYFAFPLAAAKSQQLGL